jgi:3',5'-cyclic AMP phosphodiesterase CpdA
MGFVILHLSDSHIGNPKHEVDSDHVFNRLIGDIADKAGTYGKPDLIIFNGDLAWGQLPGSPLDTQYRKARDFLDKVYKAVKSNQDSSPLLLVPGNHDIDRALVGDDQVFWRDALFKQGAAAADKVSSEMERSSVLWRRILERQHAWVDFTKTYIRNPIQLDEKLNMSHGVVHHGSLNIAVVGLNSSWACCNDEDKGRIGSGAIRCKSR